MQYGWGITEDDGDHVKTHVAPIDSAAGCVSARATIICDLSSFMARSGAPIQLSGASFLHEDDEIAFSRHNMDFGIGAGAMVRYTA